MPSGAAVGNSSGAALLLLQGNSVLGGIRSRIWFGLSVLQLVGPWGVSGVLLNLELSAPFVVTQRRILCGV